MSAEEVARLLLMYLVVPLWILAGLADWWCHRKTQIERTSGLSENAFHWVLLLEAGVGVLAAALLEINAAVLLLVFAGFLAHELTTYTELRLTARLRQIQPFEQMVHSFMELLPLLLLVLLAVMEWDQVLALFDQATPDFELRLKEKPWSGNWLRATAVAAVALNVLPLAEESWRCLQERDDRARW
jgi:hypothetical protein